MADAKIKKAVIREDLLSITSDYRKAIILNQFIYWSERVADADKFIEKENEIARNNGEEERELFFGWIYKTADELADEIMLGLSASQVRRYINDLVDAGYISKRNNPKYKWDRTLQYRVNLVKIARDLKSNGYSLADYKIDIPDDSASIAHGCAINDAQEKNQTRADERAIPETTNREYTTENTSTVKTQSNDCAKVKTCSSKDSHDTNKARTREEMLEKEQDMVREFCKICHTTIGNATIRDAVARGFAHYMERYRAYFGKVHPILTDKTLRKVCITLSEIRDDEFFRFDDISVYTPDENGVTGLREIIDEHFRREHKDYSDYSIAHFANSKYLTTIARGVVGY